MATDDAYLSCQSLFAEFPQAARVTETPWAERSMVLMVPDGDKPRFFILSQEVAAGSPFSLFPWRAPGATTVSPGQSVPDAVGRVLARGVPVPRHGSLFGWTAGSEVTALVSAYTRYTPRTPTPSWAVMPCLDARRDTWPPFTCRKQLGRWFWEYVRSGIILDLHDAIAETSGTVFWVDTTELLGSGCCAVRCDVTVADSLTLPAGRYVYYQAALSGPPVPALEVLLRRRDTSDLAPRFRATTASLRSAECQ